MVQYAWDNGTWEEDVKAEDVPEKMISIHVPVPVPKAICEDSRKFVHNLEEIADLKFKCQTSNDDIAKLFGIRVKSVPWLIKQYFCED